MQMITRDTPIEHLDISIRLKYCLLNNWKRGEEPVTVGDYIDTPDYEMLRIPNFGRKCLQEWRAIVQRVENPGSLVLDETLAEYKALRDIRACINQIAATHKMLATHYNKLADIVSPLA